MKNLFAALGLTVVVAAHAAGVGDPDSFGNNVIYLGMADTDTVILRDKCPSTPARPTDRCIELNPQPGSTSFDEDAVASIDLPAGATDSIICFSVTPLGGRTFRNMTATAARAELWVALEVTIKSSVLQDPSLIDPSTGLPLNGVLQHGMLVQNERRDMAAATSDFAAPAASRHCAYGFIHRASLIDGYGLTDAQADAFFDEPITLTFGLTGVARLVELANSRVVVRLYGDRK